MMKSTVKVLFLCNYTEREEGIVKRYGINFSEKNLILTNTNKGLFSASTLKIFACIFMFIDHFGVEIYPFNETYRIIGRLAYPIFAFFIAEGCKYTKNRLKRILTIFLLGVFCEAVYVYYSGEYYGNIMLTFSLSIILIYAMQEARKHLLKREWVKSGACATVFLLLLSAVYVFCDRYGVDYGFEGVITPLLCSVFMFTRDEDRADNKWINIAMLTVGLILLIMQRDALECQMWSLCAVPILALYNGQAGCRKMKYVFYVFYPLHLALIGLISEII